MITKTTVDAIYRNLRELYERRLLRYKIEDGDGARIMETYYSGSLDILEVIKSALDAADLQYPVLEVDND